jgi:hypothetical protein
MPSRQLATSASGDFSLYVRTYWPDPTILNGHWTPPPVVRNT